MEREKDAGMDGKRDGEMEGGDEAGVWEEEDNERRTFYCYFDLLLRPSGGGTAASSPGVLYGGHRQRTTHD